MGFAGFGGGGLGLALGGASDPNIEATGGMIGEYTSGDNIYRTHTFTASGSFVVTEVKGDGEMEYLVVGGGGAGGMGRHDGSTPSPTGGYHVWSSGGGGGGVRTNVPGTPISADNPITAVTGTYSITVGMGGMMGAGHTKTAWGRRGHDSRFRNPATPLDIIADGGGRRQVYGSMPLIPKTSKEEQLGTSKVPPSEEPTREDLLIDKEVFSADLYRIKLSAKINAAVDTWSSIASFF